MTSRHATVSRRSFLTGAAALALAGCLPGTRYGAGTGPQGAWCDPEPSAAADEIPAPILAVYRQVAADTGIPWSLLAAIGWIESRHTPSAVGPPLDGGPNVRAIPATPWGTSMHGDRRWERAVGMMQFLPSTFRTYRDRGLVDDPRNPRDAVVAAAAYLTDAGAPGDLRRALLAYNNSTRYVNDVLEAAARYDAAGATPIDCAPFETVDLAGVDANPAGLLALADAGRIGMDERNRRDVVHPRTDPRVLAIMAAIAQRYQFTVSVIKEGHYRCVGGGDVCEASRVSEHWHYRAVDLFMLDGNRVSRGNRDALDLVGWLHTLTGPLRPQEVGSPFPHYTATRGWFTDNNHTGHIHIGYEAPEVSL